MTTENSAALVLRDVTKTFGKNRAVDHLDLIVPRGALYGFIGPNGAGKTTAIRMIMSILLPDSGEITALGHVSTRLAKNRIGYLPEERGVYKKMKVGPYLTYIARLKDVPETGLAKRVRDFIARMNLVGVEDKRCEELSKGMLQKIQFIAAIIHEPDLLILDEPFSGLDPVSMRLLRDQIVAEHRRGATVLFSTHVMPQAEEICDHVVMMHRGRKVLDDPLTSIRRQFDPRAVEFEPVDSSADLACVTRLADVERCSPRGKCFEALLREGADVARAMQGITAVLPVARVERKRPSLEDVFMRLVVDGKSSRQSERSRAELKDGASVEMAS